MRDSVIVEVGGHLVSSDILTEHFCCNYEECGGSCCVIGDSGAPLEADEEDKLREEYPNYKDYMVPKGIKEIERQGYAVTDSDGDLVTPLVRGAECAYACFDEADNCMCAIEKALGAGKCKFKKPISCRLYPIRASTLSNGTKALNLHRWSLCTGAFAKGKKEKIPVYKFLQGPITDAFGADFYKELEEVAALLQKEQRG